MNPHLPCHRAVFLHLATGSVLDTAAAACPAEAAWVALSPTRRPATNSAAATGPAAPDSGERRRAGDAAVGLGATGTGRVVPILNTASGRGCTRPSAASGTR